MENRQELASGKVDEGSGKTTSHVLESNGWPEDGLPPEACSLELRKRVLALVPYFAGLDEPTLERVHGTFHAVHMTRGSTILTEGEAAERFYVIASGRVKLGQATSSGAQHLLDVLGPGDSFGALPLLGQTRNDSEAQALTSGCLLVASAEEFGALVREFPQVAVAVLEDVSSRLRDAQTRLRDSGTAPVESRLAASLLTLSERLGRPEDDGAGRTLGAPLSQEDLAALTGSTLETVNRVLAQWRSRGLVRTARRQITLLDLPALREVAEGE